MLKTLSIWNFALIEHVQIDFDKGLNILTGETGAGKSILLGALGMVIGRRTNIDAMTKYAAMPISTSLMVFFVVSVIHVSPCFWI